jgi:hypothetical protein
MAILRMAFIFSILGKLFLHFYLDSKKNKSIDFVPGFTPFSYFFFYFEDVNKKYKNQKVVCNALWVISIILLILILIFQKSKNSTEVLLEH